MKEYYGNYLGICVSNTDPEHRGRVKIFIPHIMPALYERWNQEGLDIQVKGIGNNLEGALDAGVVETLGKILPWCEACSPILGTCTAGHYNNVTKNWATTSADYNNRNVRGVDCSRVGTLDPSQQYLDSNTNSAIANSLLIATNKDKNVNPVTGDRTGVTWCASISTNALRSVLGVNINGTSSLAPTGAIAENMGQKLLDAGFIKVPYESSKKYPPGSAKVSAGGSFGHMELSTGDGNWTWSSLGARGPYQQGTSYVYIPTPDMIKKNFPNAQINPSALTIAGGNADCDKPPTNDTANTHGLVDGSAQGVNGPIPVFDKPYPSFALPEGEAGPTSISKTFPSQIASLGTPVSVRATAYSPQREDSPIYSVEGGYSSAYISPDKTSNIKTLQDYATGNTTFITVAGAPEEVGKTYIIPNITTTNSVGKTINLNNVPVAVTDVGSKVGSGHFDIPIYRDANDSQMNSQPFNSKNNNRDFTMNSITNEQFSSVTGTAPWTAKASGANTASKTNLIHTTTPIGPTPIDTNGMAQGMFAVPNVGAFLWVFFQEGNPLFPVYFGASFGPSEWNSAYKASGSSPYYPDIADGSEHYAQSSLMRPNGSGGIQFNDSYGDAVGDQRNIKIFSHTGSHLMFGPVGTVQYDPHASFKQTDGHSHDAALGNRETYTQGDDNHVVQGDHFIKIGNISQDAFDAVTEHQKILEEATKFLEEGVERS